MIKKILERVVIFLMQIRISIVVSLGIAWFMKFFFGPRLSLFQYFLFPFAFITLSGIPHMFPSLHMNCAMCDKCYGSVKKKL